MACIAAGSPSCDARNLVSDGVDSDEVDTEGVAVEEEEVLGDGM